jgi:hypothetical protein
VSVLCKFSREQIPSSKRYLRSCPVASHLHHQALEKEVGGMKKIDIKGMLKSVSMDELSKIRGGLGLGCTHMNQYQGCLDWYCDSDATCTPHGDGPTDPNCTCEGGTGGGGPVSL